MEISKIKLTQIEPADYNPRTITEEARKKLRNSIETFGLVEPIIINTKNNRIIGGHQRYDILLDMLMESDNLAEREFDYLVKDDYGYIFDFNQLQIKNEDYEKALNIVLNNTNLMGDYDYQKLGDLLNELEFNGFNLEFTGFDDFEGGSLNFGNDFNYGFDEGYDLDIIDNPPHNFEEEKNPFEIPPLSWKEKTVYLIEGETWDFGSFEIKIKETNPTDYIKLIIMGDDMSINIPNEYNAKLEEVIKTNSNNQGLHSKEESYVNTS